VPGPGDSRDPNTANDSAETGLERARQLNPYPYYEKTCVFEYESRGASPGGASKAEKQANSFDRQVLAALSTIITRHHHQHTKYNLMNTRDRKPKEENKPRKMKVTKPTLPPVERSKYSFVGEGAANIVFRVEGGIDDVGSRGW